jgi:endonuclease/exonuclease/phosphatase family metal-dependent hydrolase
MDMRFGTWNIRSMYRAVSLMAVAEDISKCKSDLVGVQEVDGTKVALNQQANIHFSMEKGMKIMKKHRLFCA